MESNYTTPIEETTYNVRCPKCNAIIPEGQAFCQQCGENINIVQNEYQYPVNKSRTKRVIATIVIVICLVTLVCGGFFLIKNIQKEQLKETLQSNEWRQLIGGTICYLDF